jgi:NTE family protein
MTDAQIRTPEVMVLGGGGILGEAWMSAVLVGLDLSEDFDPLACRRYVGTSAGSIVAASLAAGHAPGARLGSLPEQPAFTETPSDRGPIAALGARAFRLGGAAAGPLAALALDSSSTSGALLRRTALRRVPTGTASLRALVTAVERSGVGWDGRLLVAAVDVDSGRRAMFGSNGAPEVSVAQAVHASCAIPGVFEPMRAGGRSYVDGGVWSPTNMDGAEVERGESVLCINPTASMRFTLAAPIGAIGPMSKAIAAAEALALRHRGATVTIVNPDPASAAALGGDLMDASRRARVIEAGLAQGGSLIAGSNRRAA